MNQIVKREKEFRQREKPDIRELTLKHGISYPSDEELIMLILGKGTKNTPIERLAQKVLSTIYDEPQERIIEKLSEIDGMGTTRSLIMAAAMEFGRRRNTHLKSVLTKPSDVVPYVQHYSMKKTEHFIVVTVNGAHEILNIRVVSVGTVNKALIHPREVFSDAVAEHASGIICCHNHPSGPCMPSLPDRESTKVLQEAADILGISFLDHIIITKDSYFSFLENGLL